MFVSQSPFACYSTGTFRHGYQIKNELTLYNIGAIKEFFNNFLINDLDFLKCLVFSIVEFSTIHRNFQLSIGIVIYLWNFPVPVSI
jgi:hypothetical protein